MRTIWVTLKLNYGDETLLEILKRIGRKRAKKEWDNFSSKDRTFAFIEGCCEILNLQREDVLESFGMYVAPILLEFYAPIIDDDWSCLELISEVERAISPRTGKSRIESELEDFKITRTDRNQLEIKYSSNKDLIGLGIGMIKAIAKKNGEKIVIERNSIPSGTLLNINKFD